jgi:hypothetical protein
MRSYIRYIGVSLTVVMIVIGISCKKAPGPGGRATVKGKVYAYDYDNTVKYLVSKGYSSGEKVYISYGTHTFIDNNVTTGIDGAFEFRYLCKGHYKVFVNSLDTTYKIKGNDTEYPVIKEFDITSTNQTVNLEDIVINK